MTCTPGPPTTVPDRFDRGRDARIALVVALEDLRHLPGTRVPHTPRSFNEGEIHGTADPALLVPVARARVRARRRRAGDSDDRGSAEEDPQHRCQGARHA